MDYTSSRRHGGRRWKWDERGVGTREIGYD